MDLTKMLAEVEAEITRLTRVAQALRGVEKKSGMSAARRAQISL